MYLHSLKRLVNKAGGDRGSLSVLIIGLFVVLLSTALVLTDISAAYLAKRSLTIATEAATQRGMKNLDEESYYVGEYNITQFLANSANLGDSDPGVPINCEKGFADVVETLDDWSRKTHDISRVNLKNIYLEDFQCDGFEISIKTRAVATLPVVLPFWNKSEIEIKSHTGGLVERASTNNFSGFDIG